MKSNKLTKFYEFLLTDDRDFRQGVFHIPLTVAIGMFLLQWLVRDRSIKESLFASAFIFLLVCFIGLVSRAFERGRHG